MHLSLIIKTVILRKTTMFKFIIPIIIIIIGLPQCSTLLTKKDYNPSTKSLENWNIQGAVRKLPLGEKNSFITTMEKTYLNLLAGKAEIDDLVKYSRKIDNRI